MYLLYRKISGVVAHQGYGKAPEPNLATLKMEEAGS
jgi:hypothetical protein